MIDSIFRAFADHGYRGGFVLLHGWVFPDKHVFWAAALFDPHRGNADFRFLLGDLAFAKMPITVDKSDYMGKDGLWFFGTHGPISMGSTTASSRAM